MTFYRKYRPQKISELDLKQVRETLEKSLADGKFAQAYLFVGPRGAGKTSAARVLAKVVNCLDLQAGEPCLKCEMCLGIENGSAVDVMEIDAASHRGIDEIRELKDKIGLAPVAAKRKVYIIDEVHMLTAEAFNALLKTLEEPPQDVMFILCTTEAHKVPETIVSRCVRVNFTKGTTEEVVRSLRKVVEGEKLEIEEAAIVELAKSVDGSFREGHKLFEQLAQTEGMITLNLVKEFLGAVGGVEVKKLALLILKGEVKEALTELNSAEVAGVNWQMFGLRLLDYLRGQLRAVYGLGELEVDENPQRIKQVTDRIARACVEMKTAVVEALPLELAVIELAQKVETQSHSVTVAQQTGVAESASHSVTASHEAADRVETRDHGATEAPEMEEKIDQEFAVSGISIDDVKAKWQNLIQLLEPKNHSVAGFLRSCRPKSIENRFLVIEAFYKFHKEQLEQEARRSMVEEVIKDQVGLPAVRFVLGEKATVAVTKLPEHDNVGAPSGDDKLIEAVGDVFGVEV